MSGFFALSKYLKSCAISKAAKCNQAFFEDRHSRTASPDKNLTHLFSKKFLKVVLQKRFQHLKFKIMLISREFCCCHITLGPIGPYYLKKNTPTSTQECINKMQQGKEGGKVHSDKKQKEPSSLLLHSQKRSQMQQQGVNLTISRPKNFSISTKLLFAICFLLSPQRGYFGVFAFLSIWQKGAHGVLLHIENGRQKCKKLVQL